MSSGRIIIAPATVDDVAAILKLIRGLAEYEKLSEQCVASEGPLRETLFGPRRYAEVLMARIDDEPVGYALFFHNYSTFLARPGIYLEDIFVLPEHRGLGAGKAMLREIARIARDRGCARIEWSVLDWNQPAIVFYQRLGTTVLPDWRICRIGEAEIAELAKD